MSFAFSAKITVIRNGGTPQGTYDRVHETHTGHWYTFDRAHRLSCNDPGNTGCGWTSPPMTPGGSATDIENEVRGLIASGQLSGGTSINGVEVTWNASDLENYTLIMNYEDVQD